jgi:hypothetical protein
VTITIISLFFNAAGLLTAGYLLDHGLPAIRAWAATVVVGVSTGFGLYWYGGRWGMTLGLDNAHRGSLSCRACCDAPCAVLARIIALL